MRKDIFESEEEVVGVVLACMPRAITDIAIDDFVDNAKRLGLIKQSPFDKMETAWDKFRPQKYYHEDWNGLYVNYNDQWANAATAVIDAQEKVIEYLKQKLEEQS